VSDVATGFVDTLEHSLPGAVTRDAPLSSFTTYRLGGPVTALVRVASRSELSAVARVVREHRPPLLVVGRGSNLLVADRGLDGLAIVLAGDFDTIDLDADDGRVRAGGAVALPVLARRAAAAGRGGLEFFVGIPGSVGGAVRMNAGGHGRETAEVLVRAWSTDLAGESDDDRARGAADLDLTYRLSALGPSEIVTAAEFAVADAPPRDCEAVVAEVVRWRRENQPGGSNAGSVFRNPAGDSAGRIIDAAGLKGFRVGGAVVSPKHANFFQAERGATADDVYRLVVEVRRRVHDATGIVLEPELRLVGFDELDPL
jgi:UDP-N-acetylmuramate dehydrogenase